MKIDEKEMTTSDLSRIVEQYQVMVQIRLFEEMVQKLYKEGAIYGTMHLCTGQEAAAAGSAGLLQANDWITSTHRNHGHCIAKGTNMKGMLAELLGKASGTNGGRGGSMHIADIETGNLGSNGIVGGGFPIAAGAALTAQMRGTDQVAICYAGDGATNEGSFHEALNLASVWQLPVIYFIENNQYGMSTSVQEAMNIPRIAQRGASYNIEGVTIDGNDLFQVMTTTQAAIEKARAGGGPTLIEAVTYRYYGHSKSDKLVYRTRKEEQIWRENFDPIVRMEEWLLREGVMDQADFTNYKEDFNAQLHQWTEEVKKDPAPLVGSVTEHVFAEAKK